VNRFPIAHFLKHHGIAAAFQARKDLFQKGHAFAMSSFAIK